MGIRIRGAVALLLIVGLTQAQANEPAPLLANGPNENAPEAVQQFGQLMGTWSCQGSNLQPDGTWADSPNKATWTWYYVLDGYAVQDVWKPGAPQAPMGTNLRTYDAETDTWHMVWATTVQARFDEFTARFEDDRIVMQGDRWARPAFQAHAARITFHNIGKDHFDWKYEFAAPGTTPDSEATWTERSRIACDLMS